MLYNVQAQCLQLLRDGMAHDISGSLDNAAIICLVINK